MKKGLNAILIGLVIIVAGQGISNAEGIDLNTNGFVDMSYSVDNNADTNTFSWDQVELDVTANTPDKTATFRFDLQYVQGLDTTKDIGDQIVEQAYIEIPVSTVKLTFGKFNAPIGFELLDAPDMFQFSHALVFDNGLPTNLTGAMVSAEMGIADLSVYYVNGWDLATDDNKDKTGGFRLGLTPFEGLNVGLSYISGNEGVDTATADPLGRTVTDIDLTYTAIESLTIGAEYNVGTDKKQSKTTVGDDAQWNGYLIMANYGFTDKFALTLRYDSFHDKDGERLGNSVDETQTATTISPSYEIGEGLLTLFEYRSLKSDKNVFTDKNGKATDSNVTWAFELTYSF